MKCSSPGYFASIDLMPSMISPGEPQNHAFCLTPSRKVEPAHDERYKWFAPFGFVRYADEEGRTWGTPGAPARTPKLADGIAQKAWFCGPPKHVIEGIKSIEAKYPGLEHFMIHWAEGLSPAEFKEQLKWFAKDVMPAFKGR